MLGAGLFLGPWLVFGACHIIFGSVASTTFVGMSLTA